MYTSSVCGHGRAKFAPAAARSCQDCGAWQTVTVRSRPRATAARRASASRATVGARALARAGVTVTVTVTVAVPLPVCRREAGLRTPRIRQLVGEDLPCRAADVETPRDIAFKNRRAAVPDLEPGLGRKAGVAALDYAGAVQKWETLLRTPGWTAGGETVVPFLTDARERLGHPARERRDAARSRIGLAAAPFRP